MLNFRAVTARLNSGKGLIVVKWIKRFEELRVTDIPQAGGKGANLGELTAAGAQVPPGFCLVADAYKAFLQASGLKDLIATVLQGLDPEDTADLRRRAETIQRAHMDAPMPEDMRQELLEGYKALGAKLGRDLPDVAVRSSATAEDLPDASFAGQQDTYLHVKGADELIDRVRSCWASLWNARAIYYREKQNYDHFEVLLCAVVQAMVDSEISGVMFTANPVTGERGQMMINASWGLGEAVVSGTVTPDEFIIAKEGMVEVDAVIADKKTMVVERQGGGTVEVSVADYLGPGFVSERCMTMAEVIKLAKIGGSIEAHYKQPMDIEWARDRHSKELYVLQARPITTLKEEKAGGATQTMNENAKLTVLARGLAASPGIAKGPVVFVRTLEELDKVKSGDIMVTAMTNPDMVPGMKRAAAVVTDEGGRTCHAAIVSRELGIPCIVGTKDGSEKLKEGELVTVDATRGVVYRGAVTLSSDSDKYNPVAQTGGRAPVAEYAPVTGTKIYMNCGDSSVIGKYAHLPFDGIGLMRTEFIFNALGVHPMHLLRQGRGEELVTAMSESISTVAQAVYPRPLVCRLSDFRTNEFRGLEGGEEVEPVENNPMIGWRGVSRYISTAYEEGFRLECKAIKRVRDEFGLINVWVMLPFVRTTWELDRVKEILAEEGLVRNKSFKIWIMAEVPAVVFQADEFAKRVDGFSIGSNDLTQLVMGVDRDSGTLNTMGYFDERDPAVQAAIAELIAAAHRQGITCSICGQGPSLYPDFAEFLVKQGIDSMSVNPDTVAYTRRLVASVEQRLILGALRERN